MSRRRPRYSRLQIGQWEDTEGNVTWIFTLSLRTRAGDVYKPGAEPVQELKVARWHRQTGPMRPMIILAVNDDLTEIREMYGRKRKWFRPQYELKMLAQIREAWEKV